LYVRGCGNFLFRTWTVMDRRMVLVLPGRRWQSVCFSCREEIEKRCVPLACNWVSLGLSHNLVLYGKYPKKAIIL
jgi:hypothetical protein